MRTKGARASVTIFLTMTMVLMAGIIQSVESAAPMFSLSTFADILDSIHDFSLYQHILVSCSVIYFKNDIVGPVPEREEIFL